VLASCPDFISGPAGIVRIVSGEIIDSYGFFGVRKDKLENPDAELIYQWFGKGRQEEKIRNLYEDQHPKMWIDERYIENLIEFTEEVGRKYESIYAIRNR
jgi:hypothetical protein